MTSDLSTALDAYVDARTTATVQPSLDAINASVAALDARLSVLAANMSLLGTRVDGLVTNAAILSARMDALAAQVNTPTPPVPARVAFPLSKLRQPILASAATHQSSTAWVAAILQDRPITPNNYNLWVASDWNYPVYYAKAGDPEYTVVATTYKGPQGNGIVRIPAGAAWAKGGDGNLAIVDWERDLYWDFYAVKSLTSTGLTAAGAGCCKLSGDGVVRGASSINVATAMGIVSPDELDKGLIDHALVCIVPYTNGAILGSGTRESPLGGRPPTGSHLQLQITEAELVKFPAWKQTLLRAMRDYGLYIAETGGGFLKAQTNADWTTWLAKHPEVTYKTLDIVTGVDWANKLRVLA